MALRRPWRGAGPTGWPLWRRQTLLSPAGVDGGEAGAGRADRGQGPRLHDQNEVRPAIRPHQAGCDKVAPARGMVPAQ